MSCTRPVPGATNGWHRVRTAKGILVDDQARYLDAMRRFSGDPRMVAQVFASLGQRGVTPTAEHWQLLLDAHVGASDVDAAETTVSQMVAAGIAVNDERLFDLGVLFSRHGQTTRAVNQFDALHKRGARPGPKHASAVFNAFVAAQRFPAARAILRDMAQRGETVGKASYLPLLGDALKCRAVKGTEALIAMMLAAGHTPDDALANDLVLMVCQAADPRRACTLVTELGKANVTFTSSVFAAIMRGVATANDHDAVMACAAAFTDNGAALSSYARNTLVASHLKRADTDAAWDALCALWDAGMLASGENLNTVVSTSIAIQQPNRAHAALTAMLLTATPVTSDQMHAVVSALLAKNDVAGAVVAVRDALYSNVALDRRVLRDITQLLLKQQGLREVLLLLGDARHAGVVSARSYGAVLTYVLQQKNIARALQLINFFERARIRLNTADTSHALRTLARDGSREVALNALGKFTGQKVYADEPTYRELLWESARAGDTRGTQTVYDALVAAGIPREESHDKALAWATGATPRRLGTPPEMPAAATASHANPEGAAVVTPATKPPETKPPETVHKDA